MDKAAGLLRQKFVLLFLIVGVTFDQLRTVAIK